METKDYEVELRDFEALFRKARSMEQIIPDNMVKTMLLFEKTAIETVFASKLPAGRDPSVKHFHGSKEVLFGAMVFFFLTAGSGGRRDEDWLIAEMRFGFMRFRAGGDLYRIADGPICTNDIGEATLVATIISVVSRYDEIEADGARERITLMFTHIFELLIMYADYIGIGIFEAFDLFCEYTPLNLAYYPNAHRGGFDGE